MIYRKQGKKSPPCGVNIADLTTGRSTQAFPTPRESPALSTDHLAFNNESQIYKDTLVKISVSSFKRKGNR